MDALGLLFFPLSCQGNNTSPHDMPPATRRWQLFFFFRPSLGSGCPCKERKKENDRDMSAPNNKREDTKNTHTHTHTHTKVSRQRPQQQKKREAAVDTVGKASLLFFPFIFLRVSLFFPILPWGVGCALVLRLAPLLPMQARTFPWRPWAKGTTCSLRVCVPVCLPVTCVHNVGRDCNE
nr:hypothetical protein [Pandoravirus aubagnensis]